MLGTSRLAFFATTVPEENGPILKIFSVWRQAGLLLLRMDAGNFPKP